MELQMFHQRKSIGKALLTTNLGHVQENNSSRAFDYRYKVWDLQPIINIEEIVKRLPQVSRRCD